MAAVGSLLPLIFLSALLPHCLSTDDGYYTYTVGRRKLTELRLKRYVESPIQRLADDYKDDRGKGRSRSLVMVGNSAVKQTKDEEIPLKTTLPPKLSLSHDNQEEEEHDDYMGPDDFPKDVVNNNKTLMKNNITDKQTDHFTYYNSTIEVNETISKLYWVDMNKEYDVIVNEMLSSSHRRAVTVNLKFDFPFYGHIIRNISIATGGFIYTGDYIHSWLAATQYIAPLMANFDTNMSLDSQVKYKDNGTAFTVEWDKVLLQDNKGAGPFTFQVTLLKNGNIIFIYKDIPIGVNTIQDKLHPVKVGLSDAYIIDKTVFFVRRKTIYEYHRVTYKGPEITNWTTIYMTALPTCHSYNTCEKCTTHDIGFACKWCPALNKCSTGYDRNRQDWLSNHCEATAFIRDDNCARTESTAQIIPPSNSKQDPQHKDIPQVANVVSLPQDERENSGSFGHTGTMGFVLFLLLIAGCGLWVLYAYRNPHTQSGQVLIKYRPSTWTLRRGEARYTAASIHM